MSKHPSEQRQRIAAMQRARRAHMTRVDYMPCPQAVAIMEAKRARVYPGSVDATHSAVLDAILSEWAKLTGIKYGLIVKPMTSATRPELSDQKRARAHNFGSPSETRRFADAGAKDSDQIKQGNAPRAPCGARRRRDSQPCQALSVPGKKRCRWHGGLSTGPKTTSGREASLANLVQNRKAYTRNQ